MRHFLKLTDGKDKPHYVAADGVNDVMWPIDPGAFGARLTLNNGREILVKETVAQVMTMLGSAGAIVLKGE